MTTDLQLLQAHRDGDSEAFPELVRRHVDWIHNVARRRVGGDVQLAEDVTQATFLALAKQAKTIRPHVVLPAWLFRVTCFIAAQVRRTEMRRRRHERASVVTQPTCFQEKADGQGDDWRSLAPMIDEFVGRLRQPDREAILLRFYRQMTFVEVGQVLGITEEAARKRVTRALEQLRSLARRRGLMLSGASGLSVALTHGLAPSTATAAPAGMIALVTTAANASTTSTTALAAHAAALAKGALLMTTSTKIVLAAVAVLALVGGVVVLKATQGTPASSPPLASIVPTSAPSTEGASPPTQAPPSFGPDGVNQYGWTRELDLAAQPMKQAGLLITLAVSDSDRFPSGLGAALSSVDRRATAAQTAAMFLTPADLKAATIPPRVDVTWVNAHTSFTYLVAGASVSALNVQPLPGQTIMFHTSLEKPFKHPRSGDVILATFVDGHVEILTVAEARKAIATSKADIAKATTQPAK